MEACVAKSNKKKVRTFYWYFRPIAIFCMVFGVLPLKNVYHKDGSRLRFRVRSIPYMLSSIIFYSTAYLLYYYSGFVFLKKNVDIGFIWRCVAFYLMLTRSAICFLYCTTHAKKFTKLIKLLELFDIKKIDLLSIEENTGIRRFMLWSILPLISGSVCLVLGFYELAKISEGILKHSLEDPMEIYVASRIFGLLGTWQIVPLLLYIYFAMIVKYNLLDIVEILKKNKVVCNFLMKHSETEVHNIGNTRHMYTIITSAVKKMGDIFGSFLAVDQFCLISMFVVNIYVFFFTNNQDIHLLLSTLLNALIVAALINISYVIKELVSLDLIFIQIVIYIILGNKNI